MRVGESTTTTAVRRKRWTMLLTATVVIGVGVAGWRFSSAPTATSMAPTPGTSFERPNLELPEGAHVALGAADGKVPEDVTIFDTQYPAIANLDPKLSTALRRAAGDAGRSGVRFIVDSGWRTRRYQQQLLDEAIRKYGSEKEALRWVATPDTSAHVSGDAVDIGSSAAAWLSAHGAAYGLCQIYRNESWHYELRSETIDSGCPAMYADPGHDPRMRS